MIGKKTGDKMGITSVEGTLFEEVEDAVYFEMEIENAECYVYPQLTESFLKENFDVSTEAEFYKKMKEETEAILYELELEKVENEMLEELISDSIFKEEFTQKVEERYKDVMEQFEKYGKLYDMTVEEVLNSFETDRDEIKKTAWLSQGEWELALYYLDKGEIGFGSRELEAKKERYVKEDGYDSVEEFVCDNGEQYLLEEIYGKELKDYLYEKYVGELKEYEN